MKVRHLLLSVYVFLLALYPCMDSDMHEDPMEDAVAVIADHDHSHSGVEIDICTPFCNCSCCSAHVRISVPADIQPDKHDHNTKHLSLYIEKPVLDRTASIWQPPKA